MNNKLVTLLLSSFLMALLWSCEKKENRIFFEGGTAPVLTASRSGNIPMAFATQDQEAGPIPITSSQLGPARKM
jgi:hypothetical protein